ncbi:hypothetical protein [Methylobacterium sp. CM6257]
MDAVLYEGEDRLDLIRAAIDTEVRRRKAAKSEGARAADVSPSWPWGSYGSTITGMGKAVEMRLMPPVVPEAPSSPTKSKPERKPKSKSPKPSDPMYNRWTKMKAEGRDAAWDVFETFVNDIGPEPQGRMLLRRDAGQPWGPSNFFWGTAKERSFVSSRCKKYFYNGREWLLKELAAEFKIGYSALKARMKKNMRLEDALVAEVRWGPGHPKYK